MNEQSLQSDMIGSRFIARQTQLATALYTHHLDVLALNPGPSLVYLTGLNFHLMERPVVGLFTPHNPVILILPELEAGKTANLPYPVQAFPYGEDPAIWPNAFRQAALAAQIEGRRVGVEPGRMRVLELRLLEAAAKTAQYLSAEACLADLRMRKDQSEILSMRKAAQIAQLALKETLPKVKVGISEHELGAELTTQLLRAGSDVELPFAPIISSGPNGANPHVVPSERRLENGDLLVIDWGISPARSPSAKSRPSLNILPPSYAKLIMLEEQPSVRASRRIRSTRPHAMSSSRLATVNFSPIAPATGWAWRPTKPLICAPATCKFWNPA